MKKTKKCRAFCLSILCAFTMLYGLTITVGAQKVNPTEGYPYNDYKNFRYAVDAHPTIVSGWDGPDYVIANKITVRDATQAIPKILSVDDYVITFKNLPKSQATDDTNAQTVYLLNEETRPKEISTVGYTTSYSIQAMGSGDREQSWTNFKKDLTTSQSDNNSKSWEGNLGKHRALFYEYDAKESVNANRDYRFSHVQFGSVLVELEDIIYPNAGIFIKIDWRVNSTYYLGSRWDNAAGSVVNQEKLPEAQALHQAATEAAKKFVSDFAGISFTVQKTPNASGTVSPGDANANIKITTNASAQQGEENFTVPMAVILGVAAAVAGAAGVGAAAAGAVAATGDNPPGDTQEGAYQMIVGKDFGEALKFGYKQRVWARMTEIQNGVPVDRPDLTAGISIFSNEILVGASALLGANMEAEVQIQEKNPAVGIISFLYSGVYGTFQNDMRFRLLGKGEIKLKTDKVSILSTENKPFELVYELIDFLEKEPPLEITASSGLVALDLGKNDIQQPVVLISPGPDADPWDRKSFTKVCRCEMTAMDGKLPIQAMFEVTVCFEGIGTGYKKLPIDEMPNDALIECFTEAEKEKREEKALWIPLAVMKWDEKRRLLEPDTAASDDLAFTFEVHPDCEFKTPESKALAKRVVAKAKIETGVHPAPATLEMDNMKKPSAYRLLATADPDEGAAPFDIRIAVSAKSNQKLEPLALKAQIKPNPDFKGMVRWFLECPLGSAAADYITIGNVATYHGALDFIESRVYPMSGVPWSSNLLWNKDESSHYENGREDMMRKSYIAIKDNAFPKSVEVGEFKKIQTLVHELAHVIEDQHGDYKVNAKSERHAYYLQHLSDMALGLTDLETSNNIMTDVRYAIQYGYLMYMDPMIIGDLGNIGPWFGGKMKLSVHELFDKYAYHIDTLGGKIDETRRQAVAQEFRRSYFPGNLSQVEVQRGGPTDTIGRFTDTSGPFKDAEWKFVWNHGVLEAVEAAHNDYNFTVEEYHWTGGNELKLQLEIKVQDKAKSSIDYDFLSVTLDGGTFNTAARSFPSVRSFAVIWRSTNDHQHSLLFKKTGFGEVTSWIERKITV